MTNVLYTIGHSSSSLTDFIETLKAYEINALADVRSKPYSKFNPHFNIDALKKELKTHGIAYVFMGNELGARSEDPTVYVDGQVQYDLLSKTNLFQKGLDRIRQGIETHRITLMCAERDPITCHRAILICRHLRTCNFNIKHIITKERAESHFDLETRLIRITRMPENDLFSSRDEIVSIAYHKQGCKIAYSEEKSEVKYE